MKYFVVLALLLCLVGCGTALNSAAPPANTGQPSQQTPPPPPAPAPQTETYNMLAWMTMDPSLAASHHLTGTANPIYTTVLSDRFFWTKTGQGYPWDIQLYDDKYIYLWVTELNWQDPSTYKVFHDPVLGDYTCRWCLGLRKVDSPDLR